VTTDRAAAPIGLADRITTVGHASAVEIDGETVVYDSHTEQVHLLNAIASIVWWQLDGTETLAALCDELAAAFGEPVSLIRSDVLALVARFEAAELVGRVNES
jgi:Coenzyme PQQ synthesis protein D (PqqD)